MRDTIQPRYRNIAHTTVQRLPMTIRPLTIGALQRASGGDTSHWNLPGIYDPDNGEPGIADFWFNKLTEGVSYLDNSAALNWPGMLKTPVRGWYHYQRSQYSGAAQGGWVLQCLEPYHQHTHIIALDFESYGNTFDTKFMVGLHDTFEWLKARTNAKLALYTNRSLRTWLRNESLKYYGTDVFTEYLFWIAAPLYVPSPDMIPVMPPGVTTWDFLQWTWVFDGRRAGINDSTIDYNVYNGSRDKLFADFGVDSEPPEDDMNIEKIRSELDKIRAANDVLILAEAAIRAEIDNQPPPGQDVYTCTADNLHIRLTPAGTASGKYLRRGETCKVDPAKDTLVGGVTWHYHDGGPSGQAGWSSGTYLKKV